MRGKRGWKLLLEVPERPSASLFTPPHKALVYMTDGSPPSPSALVPSGALSSPLFLFSHLLSLLHTSLPELTQGPAKEKKNADRM